MEIQTFNHKEAIEIAKSIEERGYRLYTEWARKLKDGFAKNTLEFLAEQEKLHIKAFEDLYKKIIEEDSHLGELDEEAEKYLKALAQTFVFPEDPKEFVERQDKFEDILAFAIQAEKDSIIFYTELAILSGNEEAVKLFRGLAAEEKKHLLKLKELSDLVEERGIYY
ncbi:MAG: ferritin-like domain-containing protein [Clostridia bacterium]